MLLESSSIVHGSVITRKILLANCIPVTQLMQARVTRPLTESEGPQLPKILYKILQFSKDCKIVMKDCNLA